MRLVGSLALITKNINLTNPYLLLTCVLWPLLRHPFFFHRLCTVQCRLCCWKPFPRAKSCAHPFSGLTLFAGNHLSQGHIMCSPFLRADPFSGLALFRAHLGTFFLGLPFLATSTQVWPSASAVWPLSLVCLGSSAALG